MYRLPVLLLALLASLGPHKNATNLTSEQAKVAMIKKIDALFGQRYLPIAQLDELASKPAEHSFANPHDAIIYWSGANHVLIFEFAANGKLKMVTLMPEEWLHGDAHPDNPHVELSTSQMEGLIKIVDELQPMGKALLKSPYGFGFESGANLYGGDSYEHASVGHYWRYEQDGESWRYALKSVSILYQ